MRKIILLILLFESIAVTAQNYKVIKGTVTDNRMHQPLNGVSVYLKNNLKGTVTNSDGFFSLSVSDDRLPDSVIISYIGYQPLTLSTRGILQSNNDLKIALTQIPDDLNDVVVKSLSLKEILDSIIGHNIAIMAAPSVLNGYYREFVFTNDTCNEYAEALLKYYIDKKNGLITSQSEIEESRSKKIKKVSDNDDLILIQSLIHPSSIISDASLSDIRNYLPDNTLHNYKYKFENAGNDNEGRPLLKLSVLPKPNVREELYKTEFILSADDYSLYSYKQEIPDSLMKYDKIRHFLGIHAQLRKYEVSATYQRTATGIFIKYAKINYAKFVWGKFLGLKINQIINQKSEFVTTDFVNGRVADSERGKRYRKSNLYKNGNTLTDSSLNKMNYIVPSKADSAAINSIH